MVTVIYNCKKCKTGKRVEYPLGSKDRYYREDASGKRIDGGIWMLAWGGGKPTEYGGDVENGICSCGAMMTYGKLEGRYNPAVPCSAKCTSARGHTCECSCGGANHGSAW